jgi:hypothetical protein
MRRRWTIKTGPATMQSAWRDEEEVDDQDRSSDDAERVAR